MLATTVQILQLKVESYQVQECSITKVAALTCLALQYFTRVHDQEENKQIYCNRHDSAYFDCKGILLQRLGSEFNLPVKTGKP